MLNTSKHIIRNLLGAVFAVAVFSMLGVVFSPRAEAAVIDNRDWLPSIFWLNGVDCSPRAHAQANWVSPRGSSTETTATITQTQTTVPLQWQYSSGVCENGLFAGVVRNDIKNLIATVVVNTGIEVSLTPWDSPGSPVGGVSATVGSPNGIFFGYDYDYRYQPKVQGPVPIDLNVPSNLAPGLYNLRVLFKNKSAHKFTNNAANQITCVDPAGGVQTDVNNCPESAPDAYTNILLTVLPPPDVPPAGNASPTCTGINVSGAEDPNLPNQPVHFDVYYQSGGGIGGGDADGNTNAGYFDLVSRGVPLGSVLSVAFYNYDRFGNIDNSKAHWVGNITYSPGAGCPNYKITDVPTITLRDSSGNAGDNENPATADFSSTFSIVNLYGGAITARDVNIDCSYLIIKASGGGVGGWPKDSADNPANNSATVATNAPVRCNDSGIALPSLTAGDRVCMRRVINPDSGRVDGAGNRMPGSPTTIFDDASYCVTIVNKPYLSFYGSDIKAGGNFVGTTDCGILPAGSPADAGSIRAFTQATSGAGSSVQFAAFALGAVTQSSLTTASLQANSPAGLRPNGLRAQNFGHFAGCIKNFYADAEGPTLPTAGGAVTIAPGINGKYTHTGALTIHGGNVASGQHVYLYVEGDVTIDGPLTLDRGPWAAQTAIPSFYLVVSKGNITIANSVNRLDGMYIVQQNGAAGKGTINTCAESNSPGQLYATCGNKLTINGAFVANRVQFNRTLGSIRNARVNEAPGGAATACSGATSQLSDVCAAEQFVYNPALFIAEAPAKKRTTTNNDTPSRSIKTLPPLL